MNASIRGAGRAALATVAIVPLVATLSVGATRADDKAKEAKWRATTDAWRAEVVAQFNKDWAAITAAEKQARPLVVQAARLAKAGKAKKAESALLEARRVLYTAPKAEVIPLRRGLSYEIAVALATLYEDRGAHALAKRELSLMETGRRWMSRADETLVRLHEQAEAIERAYRDGERAASAGNPPPRKQRQKTRQISGYLRYRHGKVWSEDGKKQGEAMRDAARRAKKLIDEELYEDLGGTRRVQFHQRTYPADTFKVGGAPVEVAVGVVSKARGRTATLDFRKAQREAYDCRSTGKVRKVTRRGEYLYHKVCKYRNKRGGHAMSLKLPPGLAVKKGDEMTFYADVVKRKGSSLVLGRAAVVAVTRKGRTIWLHGVKTKRPVRVEATAGGFDLFDD